MYSDWRGAGAVERARLESVCTFTGTGGSNPPLSAILDSYECYHLDIFDANLIFFLKSTNAIFQICKSFSYYEKIVCFVVDLCSGSNSLQ